MIQQPHTDVKPKYKPVRRPRNPPEARKALEDKENNAVSIAFYARFTPS